MLSRLPIFSRAALFAPWFYSPSRALLVSLPPTGGFERVAATSLNISCKSMISDAAFEDIILPVILAAACFVFLVLFEDKDES